MKKTLYSVPISKKYRIFVLFETRVKPIFRHAKKYHSINPGIVAMVAAVVLDLSGMQHHGYGLCSIHQPL